MQLSSSLAPADTTSSNPTSARLVIDSIHLFIFVLLSRDLSVVDGIKQNPNLSASFEVAAFTLRLDRDLKVATSFSTKLNRHMAVLLTFYVLLLSPVRDYYSAEKGGCQLQFGFAWTGPAE